MRNLANFFSAENNGPVAWQNGQLVDFVEFHKAVAINARKFRNIKRAALVCKDSYNFTVGLFALLHSKSIIVLPANPHADLTAEYDLLIDDELVEKSGETIELKPLDPNNMQLQFFTSGSTGEPKLIIKSLQMLQNEVETLEKLWGDKTSKGTVFATVPHQHFYSLIFKILWPLSSGRPFSTVMHGLWEELLPELNNDSIIISSPAHLERLGGITSSVKPSRIFCAGAKLSTEAIKQVEKVFAIAPTEIFGSTETGAIATKQGNTNWQPLPGIKIEADEDGALQVLSPFIGPQYFPTSDIIEKTADGFRYLGRADRIVKIAGKRVSLPEVEQALCKLAKAVAVVYLKDKERLAAAIVLNDTNELAQMGAFRLGRKFREALMHHFEPASCPKLWRFVEKLPTHILGKQRDADIIALFK